MTMLILLGLIALQGDVPDPTAIDFAWYTSVGGIVTVTTFLVHLLKRVLARARWLGEVPSWGYAILIAVVLTFLTNQVWHTIEGNFWEVAQKAVVFAALASGFWSWWNAGATPIADSSESKRVRGETP